MDEIRLTSWYGKYPIIYRVLSPSQVVGLGISSTTQYVQHNSDSLRSSFPGFSGERSNQKGHLFHPWVFHSGFLFGFRPIFWGELLVYRNVTHWGFYSWWKKIRRNNHLGWWFKKKPVNNGDISYQPQLGELIPNFWLPSTVSSRPQLGWLEPSTSHPPKPAPWRSLTPGW